MTVQTRTLYCPGESPLHRANPLTKLAALFWVAATAFVLPWPALWLLSFGLIAVAFPLGFGGPVLRRYLVFSTPFSVAVFVFHGLILDRPDFQPVRWFFLAYSPQGLEHAAVIGGRISLMLASSLLFVATTHPSVLLKSFDAARWPPGLSFLLASPLLLIDQFIARAGEIRQAQQARGLRVAGIGGRIAALRVLIVPLVTLALADAHERANVLTARGFRALPRRTVLDPPRDSRLQHRLRYGLLTLAVVEVGFALWP